MMRNCDRYWSLFFKKMWQSSQTKVFGGDTETQCGAETEGKAIQRLSNLGIYPIYSQ